MKDADPMGHNYLVIRDDLPGNTELDPSLNLWALADKVTVNGPLAIYTGQHGVDLHCYVAEPTSFTPHMRTVGHTAGFAFAGHYQQTFGKPFREDQVQLRIPQAKRDGGYFVAMVPVKQGEPAPQFVVAHQLAARLVEIMSGELFDEYLHDEIFEPRGKHGEAPIRARPPQADSPADRESPPEPSACLLASQICTWGVPRR